MDIYLICVLVLTVIFGVVGIYLIFFLRSLSCFLKKADSLIENANSAVAEAEKTLDEVRETVVKVKRYFPDDEENDNSYSGSGLLKGYSLWRKLKKKHS